MRPLSTNVKTQYLKKYVTAPPSYEECTRLAIREEDQGATVPPSYEECTRLTKEEDQGATASPFPIPQVPIYVKRKTTKTTEKLDSLILSLPRIPRKKLNETKKIEVFIVDSEFHPLKFYSAGTTVRGIVTISLAEQFHLYGNEIIFALPRFISHRQYICVCLPGLHLYVKINGKASVTSMDQDDNGISQNILDIRKPLLHKEHLTPGLPNMIGYRNQICV